MAVLDWPAALPPLPVVADGQFDPNYIVTETDMGPRKKRRRYTAASTRVAVRDWHLKGDDFDALRHFYLTDTRSGSDAFNMPDPLNTELGTTPEARFDSELRWEVIVPSEHAQYRVVRVEFDLEVLP